MSKRPAISLASLSVNASSTAAETPTRPPKQVSKISSDIDNKISTRLQVAFRMNKDDYKELRRMALDEDLTVNALLINGINLLRTQKGLPPLKD